MSCGNFCFSFWSLWISEGLFGCRGSCFRVWFSSPSFKLCLNPFFQLLFPATPSYSCFGAIFVTTTAPHPFKLSTFQTAFYEYLFWQNCALLSKIIRLKFHHEASITMILTGTFSTLSVVLTGTFEKRCFSFSHWFWPTSTILVY